MFRAEVPADGTTDGSSWAEVPAHATRGDLFWAELGDHATGGGFSLMICFPWHIGTETDDDDDVYLVRACSVSSYAIDELSLAGGFLSNVLMMLKRMMKFHPIQVDATACLY